MATSLENLQTGCHALIPGIESSYGYDPSLAAGIAFSVIFFISMSGHVFRSVQHQKTASILLAVSALIELLGWAARTWGSECPYNKSAFMMQIITLVIAPVFVTAALYVILGYLIGVRGARFSLLRPRLYIIVFCTCDVIALIVQATGAAMASHAFDTGADTTPGAHIVAGGVIFQLVTMAAFAVLFVVFLVRSSSAPRGARLTSSEGAPAAAAGGQDIPLDVGNSSHGKPLRGGSVWRKASYTTNNENALVAAMWFSFVAVYVRSIFRAVQLMQGFHGYLGTHEKFFIGLDGVVMALSIMVFNLVTPYIIV